MKTQLFTLIVAVGLLSASCNKDNDPVAMDGTWTISSDNWTRQEFASSGTSTETGNTANAGTVTFNSDGTGSYNFTLALDNYSSPFNWTNTDGNVSITYSFTQSGGNQEKTTINITGTVDGNSMSLSGMDRREYLLSTLYKIELNGSFSLTKN